MLAKSILALVFAATGFVQAAPLPYVWNGQTFEITYDSNGTPHWTPGFWDHISVAAKRDPLVLWPLVGEALTSVSLPGPLEAVVEAPTIKY